MLRDAPPRPVGYVDATLRDLAPFPWGTAVGTDDLAAAAAALSEVGAQVLEALDARCARAALEARSESPWDRLRAILREAGATPVGVVVGARNLWGDRPLAPDVVRRFVLCAADAGVSRIRATDPLNDPEALGPVARACEEAGVEFVPTLIVGPAPDPGDPRWIAEAARARRPARRAGGSACPTAPATSPPAAAGGTGGAGCARPPASPVEVQVQAPGGLAPLSATAAVARGRRGRAGLRRPGGPGLGAPLGRDAARRAGRRRRAPSTARPRRSTAPRAWWGRCSPPTACARPPPPSSAPPWPCRRPSRPASISRLGRLGLSRSLVAVATESAAVARDVGAATLAYPLGAAVLPQAARHVIDGRRWAEIEPELAQVALGRAGRLRGPVAPEAARGRAARPDPGEPAVRDLAAVAEEAPAGALRGGPGAVGDVRRDHRAGGGAAALAGRRGREPAGPAGDRPRPARDAGRRGRGLPRGRGERRDLRRPGHGAPRGRRRPSPARRRRRRAGDGAPATATTRTAWCASPARWSAPSTGARRPDQPTRSCEVGQRVEAGQTALPDRGDEAVQRDRRRAGRAPCGPSASRTRTPAEFGQLLFLIEP